jgi:type II secretory ATPase GspE/PulE/Tfp pilus assembly ATPase PilB-like protein
MGFELARVRVPVGCSQCAGTGYRGRILLAELLRPDENHVGRAILERRDAGEIQQTAVKSGFKTIGHRAITEMTAGNISPMEVRRVLGLRIDSSDLDTQ